MLNPILNLMSSGTQSFQPYGAFYFVIMSANENEGCEYLFSRLTPNCRLNSLVRERKLRLAFSYLDRAIS